MCQFLLKVFSFIYWMNLHIYLVSSSLSLPLSIHHCSAYFLQFKSSESIAQEVFYNVSKFLWLTCCNAARFPFKLSASFIHLSNTKTLFFPFFFFSPSIYLPLSLFLTPPALKWHDSFPLNHMSVSLYHVVNQKVTQLNRIWESKKLTRITNCQILMPIK